MKIRDLMTTTVVSCSSETSLAAAGALMFENDCGFLPIVNETGKITGVITDRDICIALSTRDGQPSHITTGEVAQTPAFVCSPDDDIHSALKTMSKERVHRLPVVNSEGGLAGILSINDIVLHAQKGDGKKAGILFEDVMRAFQAICAHRPITVHATAA